MDSFVQLSIDDLVGCINGKNEQGEDFKVTYAPHNKVKDEFKKFVNNEIADRRKNSTISDMRKFHNYIKLTLLVNLSKYYLSKKKEKLNLIDIAVGRGGDMFKWEQAGISNVFGFDKNEESINSINPFNQGALERYRNNKVNVNIEYHVGNAVAPTKELITNMIAFLNKNNLIKKETPVYTGVQIISCQFAMHYFFKEPEYLDNIFKLYSSFLKKGGYFVGTTVDGKKIKELLKKGTTSQLFEIKKKKFTRKLYGNEYTFQINDSKDKGNYFNTINASTEYLVDLEELKRVAKIYNLEPVYTNFFESIPGKNLTFTNSMDFISFEEIKWNKTLSPDESILNNLYTTYVFVKV